MKLGTLLLGLLLVLTVVFALTTVYESSGLRSTTVTSTSTLTRSNVVSQTSTVLVLSNGTLTRTVTSTSTSVSTSTVTSKVTVTSTAALPENTTLVLGLNGTALQVQVPWSGGGAIFVGANPGASGGVPLVDNLTQVVVFQCASQAATPQGCTQVVYSGSSAYQITIWYPYAAAQQSRPNWPGWANCEFSSPGGGTDVAAYCIPLGENGFVVALPPLPPAGPP